MEGSDISAAAAGLDPQREDSSREYP